MKQRIRYEEHQKIPAAYFETLDERILARIQKEKESEAGRTDFKQFSIYRYVPAAAAIAVFTALLALVYNESSPSKTGTFTQMSADSAELANYLENTSLSDNELAYLLSEEVVDSLYNAEIVLSSNETFSADELQNLEEEFDLDYEETDI
jgi:hypothetical protein